jgi:hypothetical protein
MNSVIKLSKPLFVIRKPKPLWWIKLTKFEYWNWMTFYGPILPVWLYLGAKARSITFFTAVNPVCTYGGWLNENKMEVLALLPKKFLPVSHLIAHNTDTYPKVKYPAVVKPNNGQRGRGIEIINSEFELLNYQKNALEDFVIQEYIDSPIELAVLYSRLPNEKNGKISSITGKEFMSVKGDGISTVAELMKQEERFRFQLDRISVINLMNIPNEGENVLIEPIGNHCRGTKFIDQRKLINPDLEHVFDEIMKDVKGFYYGRFDIKVSSLSDLQAGQNIKIMELNGVNGDPAHVFDPNYSIFEAYKDVYWHWNRMAIIAAINIKNGIRPLPVSTVWKTIVNKFNW